MPTDFENLEELAKGYLIDANFSPAKICEIRKEDLAFVYFSKPTTNNYKKMHHMKKKRRTGRKFRRMI